MRTASIVRSARVHLVHFIHDEKWIGNPRLLDKLKHSGGPIACPASCDTFQRLLITHPRQIDHGVWRAQQFRQALAKSGFSCAWCTDKEHGLHAKTNRAMAATRKKEIGRAHV